MTIRLNEKPKSMIKIYYHIERKIYANNELLDYYKMIIYFKQIIFSLICVLINFF